MIMLPAPFSGFAPAFANACADMELTAAAAPIAKTSRLLRQNICTPSQPMGAIVLVAVRRRNLICDIRVAAVEKGRVMQNIRNHLHFIWADKIVAWAAILFVAMTAIGWVLVAAAAGAQGANHVVASLGLNGGPIIIALVSLWALLRAIDFIAKGSTYRLFHTQPEPPAAAASPTGDIGKPMAAL